MPAEKVTLRADLVFSPQRDELGQTRTAKDPVTGRFYRFGEVESFILQRLDGATPLETIRQRAEEKFGAVLTPQTLEQFLRQLEQLGLFESSESRRMQPGRHRRLSGSLLYLRWKLFDPNHVLELLATRLGCLFTPSFLVVSGLLIVLAGLVALGNWNEILREVPDLMRPQGLLLAWLALAVVTTAHEFAHGVACKHFGGEVREMGCMLIFFQPAFYCNVSDAWLLPEKSKRLWVTFAGAYFELFLWALAALCWRITAPDSPFHLMALVVVVTSGIKTVFNLNPLIKLDGYYLLSDLLNMPNLKARASAYLRAIVRRCWTLEPTSGERVPPRQSLIYLGYGLLSGAYSCLLLGVIAMVVSRFLLERFEAWGLLAGLLLGLVVFRQPRPGNLVEKPSVAPQPDPGPQRKPRWRKLLGRAMLGVLFLGLPLAFILLGRMELKVAGDFRVLPVRNADVRAVTAGIIEKIYVEEGDVVRTGTPIASLSGRDHRAEVQKLDRSIDEVRARLRLLQAGTREEEIALARTAIEKARGQLSYAQAHLTRVRTLHAEGLNSIKEVEEAEGLTSLRHREFEEAEGRHQLLTAGSRREEIEATQAEIGRLEAQRHYVQEQIGLLKLVSPVAGVVVTPRLKERAGEYVNKGDLVAKIHEREGMKVEILVPEKEIAEVHVGQPVMAKSRAYPRLDFLGNVVAIAPVAAAQDGFGGGSFILVTAELRDTSFRLKAGMTGHAKILCGERQVRDLLVRWLARNLRVEVWSWW